MTTIHLLPLLFILSGCRTPPDDQGPTMVPAESFVEVRHSCSAPDGPLAASIYGPRSGSPPVLAVVHVGAQGWDRHGDLQGGRAWSHYRDIAENLADAGFGVLLYDKRGTGETGGQPADLDGRVRDGLASAGCLRSVLPDRPLVHIGHSEGSIVALRASVAEARPGDRLILLSPVVDPSEVPSVSTLILRGTLDGGAQVDVARLVAWHLARQVQVPGGDHLLMTGERISPIALSAIRSFVAGAAP